MELIFKLPLEKLPFIGIRYTDGQGRLPYVTNRDLIDLPKDTEFEISVVLGQDGKCLLYLVCQNPFSRRQYGDLWVNEHQLKVFKHFVKTNKITSVNFGHVIKKFDHDKLAQTQPGMKNFVLKVNSLQFITDSSSLLEL
jgi:hypothetical protein